MPGLPTIANTYRVAVTFPSSSFSVTNVLHIEKAASSESDVAAAVDAAADVGNIWYVISDHWGAASIDVTKLDGSSASQTFSGPNVLPTKSGDYVPAAAAILSLHTALRGPRGRGRLYLGPLVEGEITNGQLGGADFTSLSDNATAFFASLVADGFTWVVASYVHSTAQPITSVVVRHGLGTQRRRQAHLL